MKRVSVVAALVAAMLMVPVPAVATVKDMPFGVHMTPAADEEGFAVVDVSKGRTTTFTFEHPSSVAGLMSGSFDVAMQVDGAKVRYLPSDTSVSKSKRGGADVITLVHRDNTRKVKVIRVFTVEKTKLTVDVTLENLADEKREFAVDFNSRLMNYEAHKARFADGAFFLAPSEGGYETTLRYRNATASGVDTDQDETTAAGKVGHVGEGSSFQRGSWQKQVPAHGALTASMEMEVATQESAVDSDRDGLPDAWEREGFTTADGEQFPLHLWGADPQRPDLFLQLNWSKSQWETLGCDRDQRYGADADGFNEFAECAVANANVYRPSRGALIQLVELFDKHGINLHIDAGEMYTNIPNYGTRYGGATEDFQEFYFKNGNHNAQLAADRDRLLGSRLPVFRVGMIGDRLEADDYSTGMGLVSDSVFYVAKHDYLTGQDQLRNTILHEFGHNLGLTHTGAALSPTRVDTEDLLKNYASVMNYLYQFSKFDYSTETSKGSGDAKRCGEYTCYTGPYAVAPDWDNLDLGGKFIGKVEATAGADDEVASHKDVTARELELAAAEDNDGQAGFRLIDAETNSIITSRTDNTVTAELRNLGLDLHDYDLSVTYPGGQYSERIRVPGQLASDPSVKFDIPITGVADLTGATMPLEVRIHNVRGDEVFAERYELSLLDYSKDEARRVREEILNNPNASQEVKDLAETKLGAELGPKEETPPAPQQGSSNLNIILAVLGAIGGIAALLGGAAWASGMF